MISGKSGVHQGEPAAFDMHATICWFDSKRMPNPAVMKVHSRPPDRCRGPVRQLGNEHISVIRLVTSTFVMESAHGEIDTIRNSTQSDACVLE
jgi:hypothetical protein